jgi:hypothetical protein
MLDGYEILTRCKTRPLETSSKIEAQSNTWIENYACKHKTV